MAEEFKVLFVEYGDDERSVHANSPREAAAKAVEEWDRETADYTCVGENTLVLVTDMDGDVTKWKVVGESVPMYHAVKVKE